MPPENFLKFYMQMCTKTVHFGFLALFGGQKDTLVQYFYWQRRRSSLVTPWIDASVVIIFYCMVTLAGSGTAASVGI